MRQVVRAEQAGFDFVEMSDHYHPWLETQGHSPFTWTLFGTVAAETDRVELATGVTCPTMRYHPAIIAQAAATLALLSDGRFTLGVGSGERLNEHVVGTSFPDSISTRQEMLREALEIIRLLWRGGYRSYEGRHLQLQDARVFDLPQQPPPIAVAASGPDAAATAAELGDGLFVTEPEPELTRSYSAAGGSGPCYGDVPVAWARDEHTASQAALETTRWALPGWKVMSELPNPVNFFAATTTVREQDIRGLFACGPDVPGYLDNARKFLDAGFDSLVMQNAGPDPDGFMDFFQSDLAEPLRQLDSTVDTTR